MKIQCDVCNKDEASVFCSADEAALCAACDRRVHQANMLAVKHLRFSLLRRHSNNEPLLPLCDVCQERRAFLFCQQDRAILCRDCDLPIHTANLHTHNHSRFILTGVKLSSPITTPSDHYSSTSVVLDSNNESHHHHQNHSTKTTTVPPGTSCPPSIAPEAAETPTVTNISKYLIEMLPGWQVEDLLDSPNYNPCGFYKNNDDASPFLDDDLQSSLGSFPTESLGIWVPQAPPPPHQVQQYFSKTGGGKAGGFKDSKNSSLKANYRWREDASTVPQISPSQRPRQF